MPTHIQADQDSEIVVPTNSEARQKFQSLLSQFTSLTSKEEFLRQVRWFGLKLPQKRIILNLYLTLYNFNLLFPLCNFKA